MSHYKPYPAYTDSSVEWLGKVPLGWAVKRVRFLARKIGSGKTPTGGADSYVSNGVTFLRSQNIHDDGLRLDDVAFISEATHDEMRTSEVRPNDVLLNITGASIGRASLVPAEFPLANVNQHVCIVRCGSRSTARWVHSSFCSRLIKDQVEVLQTGAGREGLNFEQVGNLQIALPPEGDQPAIAAALDCETARIDALIAKKTRFIELLKEKRQALITHAVTKGLDPNVTMKDSGVAWIGDVPEHWEVSKLAYTTREAGGKTPDTKNEAYWGGDVPWVSPKDMKQSEIIGAIDTISDTAVQECGMRLFAPGAILAVVRGMILAHSFPVATLAVPATINQDMKALEPDARIRPNYLRLVLEAAKHYVVSVLVAEAAHGTRVLRTDVWRQLPALLPPVDEQDSILAELDRVATRYDKLTAKVDASIALLRERRSALITAAVTGQIDLREEPA